MRAYGGACACCGESRLVFLAIDHIDNDGYAHRKEVGRGSKFYRWLRRHGYPPGYQVLCHNCNFAKHMGGCPHQEEGSASLRLA